MGSDSTLHVAVARGVESDPEETDQIGMTAPAEDASITEPLKLWGDATAPAIESSLTFELSLRPTVGDALRSAPQGSDDAIPRAGTASASDAGLSFDLQRAGAEVNPWYLGALPHPWATDDHGIHPRAGLSLESRPYSQPAIGARPASIEAANEPKGGLRKDGERRNGPWQGSPGLRLQPMVHVDDMAAALSFYERLGAEIVHGDRDSDWVLLQLGTMQIGLLAHPPDPARGECTVELNFAAAMPLHELEEKLRRDGVTIVDVAARRDFGAQLHVRTPDGLLIKISQLEPDLHT